MTTRTTRKKTPANNKRPTTSSARARTRRATGRTVDSAFAVEGVLFALKRTIAERNLEQTARDVVRGHSDLTKAIVRLPGSRWFRVGMRKGSTPAAAFAAARALLAHRAVRLAEPALLVPGLTLDPDAFPELAAEMRALSGPRQPTATRRRPAALAYAAGLDPTVDCEWSLKLARVLDHDGAPGAWTLSSSRGAGVVVGHPDTGYTTHDEVWSHRLQWRHGWNYVEGNADPLDPLSRAPGHFPSHGTATSSVIISDAGDPPIGELPVEAGARRQGRARRATGFVSGVAPAAALVPLRVSNSVIHFSFANVAKALRFATVRGHHVVSMSLGGPFPSDALFEAVDDAVRAGLIVCGAAGNVWPWVVCPARYPGVLSVAACNAMRRMWSGSATGPRVDVTAPGEDVWGATTLRAGNGVSYVVRPGSGTSFAVATTAGIAALWLAHHGVQQLRRTFGADLAGVFRVVLEDTAKAPLGWDKRRWGAGIVDAHALLQASLTDVARLKRRARAPRAQAAAPAWSFAELFPDVSPAKLDAGIDAIVQSKAARRRLERDRLLGRELHWLLLSDGDARRALRAGASSRARSGVVATAAAGLPPQSKRSASPALQQVLR